MNTQFVLALVGIAGALVGAVVNGALATRAKVNEEIRKLRLESYPQLWQLTSHFSRWPRTTNTYEDLERFHVRFRTWYYETGGLYLSENSRARYGDVQELTAAHLGAAEGGEMPPQPSGRLPDPVYTGMLQTCSALRTALTEDLESRRLRSVLYRTQLALRHRRQAKRAATRLAAAKRSAPSRPPLASFRRL